jgi:hypothetical protein
VTIVIFEYDLVQNSVYPLHGCVFVGLAEEEVLDAVLLLVDAVPPTSRVTETLDDEPVLVEELLDAPVDGNMVELVGRVTVLESVAYVTPVGSTLSPVSFPVVSVSVPLTIVFVSLELVTLAVPLRRVVESASTA